MTTFDRNALHMSFLCHVQQVIDYCDVLLQDPNYKREYKMKLNNTANQCRSLLHQFKDENWDQDFHEELSAQAGEMVFGKMKELLNESLNNPD